LVMEAAWPEEIVSELSRRGHEIARRGTIGVTQAIDWSATDKKFHGAHDPRVPGKAAGDNGAGVQNSP
jgi:gamma-glutamyltranspeptidase